MFLRPYKRFKDGKQHTYYALVESVRTANGPRQHIVAYLGELNHDQERRWQRTVVFYNRQGDAQPLRLFPEAEDVPLPDDPDIVQVRLQQVGWTNARRFGDVWLAWQLWQMLHLDAIVHEGRDEAVLHIQRPDRVDRDPVVATVQNQPPQRHGRERGRIDRDCVARGRMDEGRHPGGRLDLTPCVIVTGP